MCLDFCHLDLPMGVWSNCPTQADNDALCSLLSPCGGTTKCSSINCRQLDAVMTNMQALESKLEAKGINVKELGPLPYDYPTE